MKFIDRLCRFVTRPFLRKKRPLLQRSPRSFNLRKIVLLHDAGSQATAEDIDSEALLALPIAAMTPPTPVHFLNDAIEDVDAHYGRPLLQSMPVGGVTGVVRGVTTWQPRGVNAKYSDIFSQVEPVRFYFGRAVKTTDPPLDWWPADVYDVTLGKPDGDPVVH